MLRRTAEVYQPGSLHQGEQSLRALFESEEPGLLRYAFSLTGRRAVAEEIVQEVFLQLHARWEEVVCPNAWLYRSVRNRGLNHLRKCKYEILGDEDVTATPTQAKGESPDATAVRLEVTAAVRKQVGQLEPADRELIELKYFGGLTYREISEQTGMTISNVGYRLHHILKRLAGSLQSLGPDSES